MQVSVPLAKLKLELVEPVDQLACTAETTLAQVVGVPVYKETTEAASLAGGIGDGPGAAKLTTKEAVAVAAPNVPGIAA